MYMVAFEKYEFQQICTVLKKTVSLKAQKIIIVK